MSIDDFIKKAEKTAKKKEEIPEKEIEEHFVKHAKNKGCSALKLALIMRRSFPDRTVLCPGGYILFIEFKKKDKDLTEAQDKWRKILVELGFHYYVCDEIGQAERILDEFLDERF